MKSLTQLFTGYGELAAQAVEQALQLGVSLGQSVAEIAQNVEQALMQPLYRALTVASDFMMSAFRGSSMDVYQQSDVQRWRWTAEKGPNTCGMCIAMDGTLHDMDEDLDSHPNCHCQPVPVGDSTDEGYQTGQDWFSEQDASVQEEILGPSKFAAFQADAIDLSDLIGIDHSDEYGVSRYERSLKEIVGAKKAKQYYG